MNTATSNQIKSHGSNSLRFSIDSLLTRKKIPSSSAVPSKVRHDEEDREEDDKKSIDTGIKNLSKTPSKQEKNQRTHDSIFDKKTRRTSETNDKQSREDSGEEELDQEDDTMSHESDYEDETSMNGSTGTPGPASTTSHSLHSSLHHSLPMYSQVQMASSAMTPASLSHHPWPSHLHPHHPLVSPLNHAHHPFLGWMRSSQGSPLSPSSLLSEYI